MGTGARFVLIGGGVRSGKSAFALARARELGTRRAFIATAIAFDDEMQERATRHREERGDAFTTFEAPRELVATLREASAEHDVVVIDCLTLWLSNMLLDGLDVSAIDRNVRTLRAAIATTRAPVIVVSNEVGMGIVPESKLGRVFRDVAGGAHRTLSADCDELYFAMMGQLLRLKPAPLGLVDGAERA